MLFRRDRVDGPDPWLNVKIGLFFLAALLCLAGAAADRIWLVRGATAILVLALLLGLLPRSPRGEDS